MHKVSSFFMVIGLTVALHVNAQGGGFRGGPPPMGGGQPLPPPMMHDEERSTVENDFCILGGTVTLRDVSFTLPNGELMRVRRDKHKNASANGHLHLATDSLFTYEGNVFADKKCTVAVTVDSGVTWHGALNPNHRTKQATAVIHGTWTLTRDSYVNRLVIAPGATVNTNGHRLKYTSLDNQGTLN